VKYRQCSYTSDKADNYENDIEELTTRIRSIEYEYPSSRYWDDDYMYGLMMVNEAYSKAFDKIKELRDELNTTLSKEEITTKRDDLISKLPAERYIGKSSSSSSIIEYFGLPDNDPLYVVDMIYKCSKDRELLYKLRNSIDSNANTLDIESNKIRNSMLADIAECDRQLKIYQYIELYQTDVDSYNRNLEELDQQDLYNEYLTLKKKLKHLHDVRYGEYIRHCRMVANVKEWLEYSITKYDILIELQLGDLSTRLKILESDLASYKANYSEITERLMKLGSHKASLDAKINETTRITEVILPELNNTKSTLTHEMSVLMSLDMEYETYIDIFNPKGEYMSRFIGGILRDINAFVNSVIQEYIKYTCEMIITDKGFEILIKNGNVSVSVGHLSGFEQFILDIAIKACFNRYGAIYRSEFFAIDEGLDVIDRENICKLDMLFNTMKSIYKNIIIITHRDGIDQYCNNYLEI
jgi:DNA repair exonuclease SbcCD ATPase subunit